MIETGEFRQDLFYRLNVMPIELPPLRERLEDIPVLVEHFIDKFNELHGRRGGAPNGPGEIRGIHASALNALRTHSWPGNIRELENLIERAFVLETSPYLTLASMPDFLRPARATPSHPGSTAAIDFHNEKEHFEREFIVSRSGVSAAASTRPSRTPAFRRILCSGRSASTGSIPPSSAAVPRTTSASPTTGRDY